jgi:Tol biopolymer transport system component
MPRWSPDGTMIAYNDQRGVGIYVVLVATGEFFEIADFNAWPEWVDDHLIVNPVD